MRQAATVWIDVEDLFQYVRHNARPSGIQRLTYELYTALQAQVGSGTGGRSIGFLRIEAGTDAFRPVPWEQVRMLCQGLTRGPATPSTRQRPAGGTVPHSLAVAVQYRLPGAARAPFRRFCTLQLAALGSLRTLGRELVGRGRPVASAALPADPAPEPRTPAGSPLADIARPAGSPLPDVARPGDWLLSLGASWHRTDYGCLLQRARDAGLRTGMLFYDLIPLRRPEWCHHTLVAAFGQWLDGVLPALDLVLAISNATADDLRRLLAGQHRPAAPVRVLPIGTGFPASLAGLRRDPEPVPDHALPPAGSYVLFVSTIEARKNHVLMFQVWRRLLAALPPAEVPTLVFAGRVGWLVADLMLQIANTNYCDGKLLIVEDPSDAVLMRLYEGCLFTVLPSLYEGWGLPVTESLAVGKPCVISNLSALPETGGGLARTLDPFDLNDATSVIRGILDDREGLARWEMEVRQRFVPVPWARSAAVLLDALDAHDGAVEGAPGQPEPVADV